MTLFPFTHYSIQYLIFILILITMIPPTQFSHSSYASPPSPPLFPRLTHQHNTETHDLKILTFNVRYDSKPDNISVNETLASLPKGVPVQPEEYYRDYGERPWSVRRIGVAGVIGGGGMMGVGVFGGQELLHRQVLDLQELLGEEWSWIGVGRDNGGDQGEYSPVFYRRDLYHVISNDTFWLTSTPFEVSKFPGAGSRRICTVVRFLIVNAQCGSTGDPSKPITTTDFTVLNTHLDDQSAEQRQLGASLILHRAKYEAIKTRKPVILTGDFNSPPHDTAYRTIVGEIPPVELNSTFVQRYSWKSEEEKGFEDFVLKDLLGKTPAHRRSGHYATFTDFAAVGDTSAYERLDYIFIGDSASWTAQTYHVGSNLYDDGLYASDHRPVMAAIHLGQDMNHSSMQGHNSQIGYEGDNFAHHQQASLGP